MCDSCVTRGDPELPGQRQKAMASRGDACVIVDITASSNEKGYIEYTLACNSKGKTWSTVRRYREFLALDVHLRQVPGYQPLDLPPKGFLGIQHRFNLGTFNSDRQVALQEYLANCCVQLSTLTDVPSLNAFLSVPSGIEFSATTAVAASEAMGAANSAFNRLDPKQEYGLAKPIFMIPKKDIEEENGIIEVAFGEAQDVSGIEVTVVFKDEDRPSHVEDVVYDAIRKPLFGRSEDIETFTLVKGDSGRFESILFKGTYSGDQDWMCKVPKHLTETVSLTEFTQEGDQTVIWINVWNHLFGPRNTNPTMEMIKVDDYVCTRATRAEVDSRYHGMITTVA